MAWRSASASWRQRALRVLVDMDGVICDFEGWFLQVFRSLHPNDPFIPLEDRNKFYIDAQYREIHVDLQDKCNDIIGAKGFFRDIPPIPGAIDALKEMSGFDGVQVFLCTSPMTSNVHCVSEKFEWVNQHLGRDWISRTIVTCDKTVIAGDLLIDDRHKISGVVKSPSWDHVLFTACHNKHLDIGRLKCKHRLDGWTADQWTALIEHYKKAL